MIREQPTLAILAADFSLARRINLCILAEPWTGQYASKLGDGFDVSLLQLDKSPSTWTLPGECNHDFDAVEGPNARCANARCANARCPIPFVPSAASLRASATPFVSTRISIWM